MAPPEELEDRTPPTGFSIPLVLVLGLNAVTAAADWPDWRGMGQTDDKKLPLVWNGKTGENVLWKAELPLSGAADGKSGVDQNQSSPIVYRGRVFVTVSHWSGKLDPKQQPERHVVCYRAEDGKRLWNVAVEPGPWTFADLRGGYTAPTSAADDERVYVAFGSSVLAALTHDGKPIWRKEIKPFKFASPVAAPDGRIYLASAGRTYGVKAGDTFEILATNDLGDDSPASPAVADGRMYLKGRKTLYCVATKE